jgi:hypothetical protein
VPVFKNVETMAIVSGNPAQFLRKRELVHKSLCVESLLGNDLISFYEARIN